MDTVECKFSIYTSGQTLGILVNTTIQINKNNRKQIVVLLLTGDHW